MRKLVVLTISMAFFLKLFLRDSFASEPAVAVQSQDEARDFNEQIVVLRKIKMEYSRARKVEYFKETEDNYQWALFLYRQQRWQEALAEFYNVEDHIAEYKSTNQYIKFIQHQIAQGKKRQKEINVRALLLKQKIIKEVKGIRVLTVLIKRYAGLYEQGLLSRDGSQMESIDKNIESVYKGLQEKKKSKQLLVRKLDLELYVSRNLGRVMNKANKFDQEVFSLSLGKDYVAASRKVNEFQKVMLEDLKAFKETLKYKQAGFINSEKLSHDTEF